MFSNRLFAFAAVALFASASTSLAQLAEGQLVITDDLTIDGPGANNGVVQFSPEFIRITPPGGGTGNVGLDASTPGARSFSAYGDIVDPRCPHIRMFTDECER